MDDVCVIYRLENHLHHFRVKLIGIRHCSNQDLMEDKLVSFKYVPTECQMVDILTKLLDVSRYESLRNSLGLCFLSWLSLRPFYDISSCIFFLPRGFIGLLSPCVALFFFFHGYHSFCLFWYFLKPFFLSSLNIDVCFYEDLALFSF